MESLRVATDGSSQRPWIAIALKLPNDFAMRNRRYDRLVCEDFLRLDIRELSFDTDAPEWEYPVSLIAVSMALDHVRVQYDGLDHRVEIERTRCNYGGTRPWFLCPACGDRRAVLYTLSGGGFFGCQRCLRLLYLSECEDTFERSLLKVPSSKAVFVSRSEE